MGTRMTYAALLEERLRFASMGSTRPNLHSPMAGPPRGPRGASSEEKACESRLRTSGVMGALWPESRSAVETSGRCFYSVVWVGIMNNMRPAPPSTTAWSSRPETPVAACGRRPTQPRRGSGEIALRGQERPQHKTGIAVTLRPSPKRSDSSSATNLGILTI